MERITAVENNQVIYLVTSLHLLIAALWILFCTLELLVFYELFPNILEETRRKINPGRMKGYLAGIAGLNLLIFMLQRYDTKLMK